MDDGDNLDLAIQEHLDAIAYHQGKIEALKSKKYVTNEKNLLIDNKPTQNICEHAEWFVFKDNSGSWAFTKNDDGLVYSGLREILHELESKDKFEDSEYRYELVMDGKIINRYPKS
jgi:hypothetical protein